MQTQNEVVLSLISHTNIGKTTLTRTLLRRDVGEVRDEAHVTEESERFSMLETPEDKLVVWDTPGFGNVAPLLKRLQQEGGAFGWVMHELVDRVFNRSLYSSLEAAKNVRAEADVVLYLVNAKEHPADAGYVQGELKLLEALGKPVLMVLNQISENQMQDNPASKLRKLWENHFRKFSCLKKVILLDAFHRIWLQELQLMDDIKPWLTAEKQRVLARLRKTFEQQQSLLFADCAAYAGKAFWHACHQNLEADEERDAATLFGSLVQDLQSWLDDYLDLLVERHGIQAQGKARLKADIKQATGMVQAKVHETKAGLLAGAVTSAGTGLVADVLAGGLTLGGGAILGFLGGYLGGLSYAKTLNFFGGKGKVAWKRESLKHFYQLLLNYYLLAALHGRGKGKLQLEAPAPLVSENLDRLWPNMEAEVDPLVQRDGTTEPPAHYLNSFADTFKGHVFQILTAIYPDLSNK